MLEGAESCRGVGGVAGDMEVEVEVDVDVDMDIDIDIVKPQGKRYMYVWQIEQLAS